MFELDRVLQRHTKAREVGDFDGLDKKHVCSP
jgi:hypothetical protein